jgi:hypothetical protein
MKDETLRSVAQAGIALAIGAIMKFRRHQQNPPQQARTCGEFD